MDFDFSDEQLMFQRSLRGLLEDSYSFADLRARTDGAFDEGLWAKLTEAGVFSLLVPEAHGGMEMGFADLSPVLEEFGRALVPPPVTETITATDLIVRYGTEDQKARLLPAIAEGGLRIVPAISETESGFDPQDIGVVAVPAAGGWTVRGRKILVPQAAIATHLLLALRFGENGPLGLALVESGRAGTSLTDHATLDLTSRYHMLDLTDLRLAPEDVLGGTPEPAAVQRLFDSGAVIAAAVMIGIAARVLEEAVAYAGQRVQFGKPIGSFQAIKHRCADMAVAIDASQSAVCYAAWALADDRPDRARAVSIAKSQCGDAARFVCNEGIQIHGGIGFTWELGLHLFLRRVKMLEFSFGDAAWHRERIVAETLNEPGVI